MKVYLITVYDTDGELTVGVETDLDKAIVLYNKVSSHEKENYYILVVLREWDTTIQEYNCLKYFSNGWGTVTNGCPILDYV